MKKTGKQIIGRIGEDIARKFLVKHGYSIVEQNFLRKVGEIDIVCRKGKQFYFVEVKTVSRENISRETPDTYRPEDNLHNAKILRLSRVVEVYLEEKNIEEDWEIMAIAVLLDQQQKIAKVKMLKDFAW